MKQVISGKTYNTDTAELIGEASYGDSGDFEAWFEELYKTKKGAYFVAGEGGAMSRYGVQVRQGEQSGSSAIRVLSEAEALGWCEENSIDPDVIEEYFEVEEG